VPQHGFSTAVRRRRYFHHPGLSLPPAASGLSLWWLDYSATFPRQSNRRRKGVAVGKDWAKAVDDFRLVSRINDRVRVVAPNKGFEVQ